MSEARKVLIDPLVDNNPVTLQMLGICSALAVTTSLLPALLMCVALTSVVALSSAAISALRHRIPNNIRIIVHMTIIASLVILVDELLKAYAFETSKQFGLRRPDHHQLHRPRPRRGLRDEERRRHELSRRPR